ncbi:MAG TPA: hypothetical protein VK453_14925 [Micromonosporaceae bacterium]|nr:hypothetical protein [Micromonosporaceae bacterium]
MSPSPRHSQGLIGNAVAGYLLALVHWRQLLAVLLPVLTPAVLGLVLLDLLVGRDNMVMMDYVPLVRDDGGKVLAWARLGLVPACWMLALSATAVAVTGAERGHAVRPVKAIRAAVRHFPVFAIGMCTVVVATVLMLWVVAAVAATMGSGVVGLILILGTLAVAAVVSARMLVGVISHQLGGSDWRLTRGRVTSTAGAFLLGGVVVPLFLVYLGVRVLVDIPLSGAIRAMGAVLPVGLIAAQAGILAHVYLLQRDVSQSPGQESTDLSAIDAPLADLSGEPPRRRWLAVAVAAMIAALLASPGVEAANPFGAPTVRSHEDTLAGASAVAWPAGQHPTIATTGGARFCDNDVCDRYTARNGGPVVMDGVGTAGISADGATVLKAAVTGSQERGGPFLHYARCTRDGCPEAWLPVRASAEEPFGWPEIAVAVGPDDAIWFAVAMPSADNEPGKATYRITFVRCADLGCARPQRHEMGTVWRMPGDGSADRHRVRLSIGTAGQPVATVRTGLSASRVTCEPVSCTNPTTTHLLVGQAGTAWTTVPAPTGPVVAFQPGELRIGERMVPLKASQIASGSGALAATTSRVYATAAEATNYPGLRIRIGPQRNPRQPEYLQQVLWRCDGSRCRRHVLDAFETTAGNEMLAVSADDRVLIVRQDRILLFSPPASG